MTYYKQICDGFNKKSLMGNWWQQRQYPNQPFRQQQHKEARDKQDNKGFVKAIPRIQRRSKWQTRGRIILDDGFDIKTSQMKAAFPYGEIKSGYSQMKLPVNKTFDSIKSAQLRPHSQFKPIQKKYLIMNYNNFQQQINNQNRKVLANLSEFGSILPKLPSSYNQNYFGTTYKNSYIEDTHNYSTIEHKNSYLKTNLDLNPEQQIKPKESKLQEQSSKKIEQHNHNIFKQQKNIPQNDLQTSLNLNVGLHQIHPKHPKDGQFRIIRKDVTLSYHQSPCKR